MKRFQIYIDPEVLARLQAAAAATGTTVATVIRLCVDRELPKQEAHIKKQQEKI
jgi:hypothetical protein